MKNLTLTILLILTLIPTTTLAQSHVVEVRDSSGRLIERHYTREVGSRTVTVVRDSSGKRIRKEISRNGKTKVRDASGKLIKTEKDGVARDRSGKVIERRSVTTIGSKRKITVRNASGRIIRRETVQGNKKTIRGPSGELKRTELEK